MASFFRGCISNIRSGIDYFDKAKRLLAEQKLLRAAEIKNIAELQTSIFNILWERNIRYPNLRKLKTLLNNDRPMMTDKIKNVFVTYYKYMGRDVSLYDFKNINNDNVLLKYLIEILITDIPSYSLAPISDSDLEYLIQRACAVDPANIPNVAQQVINMDVGDQLPGEDPPPAPRFHKAAYPPGSVRQPPSGPSSVFYQPPGPPPDYYYGNRNGGRKRRAKKTHGRKTHGRKTRGKKTHAKRH